MLPLPNTILINNVGALVSGRFTDLSSQLWEYSLTINILSHVLAMQAALPAMIRQHGEHLLFMGSDKELIFSSIIIYRGCHRIRGICHV